MSKKKKSFGDLRAQLEGQPMQPREDTKVLKSKLKKIARRYGGDETIHDSKGDHFRINIEGGSVVIGEAQHGNKREVSRGVIDTTAGRIAQLTGIPKEELHLYLNDGGGRLGKDYRKKFEDEYLKE